MTSYIDFGLDYGTLLKGLFVFLARAGDVTLGTLRTISIVHGRTKAAFFLGFVEISIWLIVIATVLNEVLNKPILGIFYALGFSLGNVSGILVEKKLAFGHIALRVICQSEGKIMAEKIRETGYGVTTFIGEGKSGPVTMLYVICRRKDLQNILLTVKNIVPEAFYIIEQAGKVSKLQYPFMQPPTGWRAIMKKK
ncbi:MAG: DUF2179 domain-containing protein [Candidatus Loosdrechtia sp.]|uniref:DUF2179 domain-containing protein n=1 Tax=Candidatus Loosdrechtia sp. TaxID=3101272 RepID=UPI003A78B986|nr:MAG: DUF5698 domain-containing protein [Candidatus Jettenia sp. AMX2]